MQPERIREIVGPLPYMTLRQGELIHSFITQNKLKRCLELGFYHGVSSAYIAGALQDLGDGSLITIDLATAKNFDPNISTLLDRVNLRAYVNYYYEPTSYTWRLMRFLEEGMQDTFDFCYIDGGHSWDCTGFAYCLVARLLKAGGWILFDDLDWTFERSPALHNTPWVRNMPLDERQTPQVRKVYELLVKTDPRFDKFMTINQWGFARKALAELQTGRGNDRVGQLDTQQTSYTPSSRRETT